MFAGWHPHNGVSLGCPQLGFVVTKVFQDGEPYDEGYFEEFDQPLLPEDRVQYRPVTRSPDFDPDRSDCPAVAVHLDFSDYEAEVPQHQHRQGQLILALHGAVTCTAANGLWIVPPDCGVWIPGGVPHSNQVTSNARLSYLFVEPGAAALPLECCTLSVSPMLREMILRLADVPGSYGPDDHVGRLVRVLLDELALMPKQGLELPVSSHPKIAMIAAALTVGSSCARSSRRPRTASLSSTVNTVRL